MTDTCRVRGPRPRRLRAHPRRRRGRRRCRPTSGCSARFLTRWRAPGHPRRQLHGRPDLHPARGRQPRDRCGTGAHRPGAAGRAHAPGRTSGCGHVRRVRVAGRRSHAAGPAPQPHLPGQAAHDLLRLCCADPTRVPRRRRRPARRPRRRRRRDYDDADAELVAAAQSLLWVLADRGRYAAMQRAITAPVLLLHGDQDRLVPIAAARPPPRRTRRGVRGGPRASVTSRSSRCRSGRPTASWSGWPSIRRCARPPLPRRVRRSPGDDR